MQVDYLFAKEHEWYNGKLLCAFFPLEFCGYRWLEDGKVITFFLKSLDTEPFQALFQAVRFLALFL